MTAGKVVDANKVDVHAGDVVMFEGIVQECYGDGISAGVHVLAKEEPAVGVGPKSFNILASLVKKEVAAPVVAAAKEKPVEKEQTHASK